MNPASNVLKVPVAALLTWLLPGAGHLYIGERVRGIILMVAIAITFWGGIAIGGVKNTVNPTQRSLWFLAQICAGGHTLTTLGISRLVDDPPPSNPSLRIGYGPSEEIPVVYTAICGMLNILIILDVLVRAEKSLSAPGGAAVRGGAG